MKLGMKPFVEDRKGRTLQFAKYIKAGVLPYFPSESHFPNAAPLGMLMNDVLGDCMVAGPLHNEMIWSKCNGIDYKPTDQDAEKEYEKYGNKSSVFRFTRRI